MPLDSWSSADRGAGSRIVTARLRIPLRRPTLIVDSQQAVDTPDPHHSMYDFPHLATHRRENGLRVISPTRNKVSTAPSFINRRSFCRDDYSLLCHLRQRLR